MKNASQPPRDEALLVCHPGHLLGMWTCCSWPIDVCEDQGLEKPLQALNVFEGVGQ